MRNLAIAFAAVLLGAGVARAEAVDWSAAHEHDVIEILTTDPDGELRETKVWVAALDDRGYVRTNDSRWFQNLVREPNAAIRFGDAEYPARAEVVLDPALRARVDAVFAEKYPLSMWIAGIFGRTGGVNCVAFSAREP
jgi:hypothetical protein